MAHPFTPKSTAGEVLADIDLHGINVLLTGCNSGLGLEAMRVLAGRGAHVIGAARSLQASREACAHVDGATTPLACDLGDFASVRRAQAELHALGRPLHRIIANAGIMMLPALEQLYGLEKQFVVNYLGHHLLIGGLTDLIPAHAGARVVIVASEAHRWAPPDGIELDNLSGERGYGARRAYGQSNVARILYARALARRLRDRGITANSLHPGVIGATGLWRHVGPLMRFLVRRVGKTIPQGAATQCFLAAHPAADSITGEYFNDCRIARPAPFAEDDLLGERLWSLSEALLATHAGIATPSPPR